MQYIFLNIYLELFRKHSNSLEVLPSLSNQLKNAMTQALSLTRNKKPSEQKDNLRVWNIVEPSNEHILREWNAFLLGEPGRTQLELSKHLLTAITWYTGLWWSGGGFLQWRGTSKTWEESWQKQARGFESGGEGSGGTGNNRLINADGAPAKFNAAFDYIQCFRA